MLKTDVFVYVAGPYSGGDTIINIRKAIQECNALLHAGYTPYCPHLTGFWHLVCPRIYEDWLEFDIRWLRKCNVLLRMSGASSGADKEVLVATALHIPVVNTIRQLERYYELHLKNKEEALL